MKQLLILTFLCTLALAKDGLYLGTGLSYGSVSEVKSDDTNYELERGYGASLAVGYKMDAFRAEAEALYLINGIDTVEAALTYEGRGDFTTQSALFNLYYDATNETRYITSLGLGVGVAKHGFEDIGSEDVESNQVLAYQASLAVGYRMTPRWILECKYRYFGTEPFKVEGTEFKRLGYSGGSLTLRYHF